MRPSLSPHDLRRVTTREHESIFGTQILKDGVRFRLWAPKAGNVRLQLYNPDISVPMMNGERGWFELVVEGVHPGRLYRYVLDGELAVPDPASRYQPDDVDGPSEIIDPRGYSWADEGWRGRPWEETIFYELHVGTFTQAGTFRAAIERMDYLVELGITAIQLMPVAAFSGRWNWGYDGALLFAPDATYGRPEDLKALVDAAHARGMMVFLDVVYNHFGPKGNYMAGFAPLMTEKHKTPWGPAVNFDDDGSRTIRDFVSANARYWLDEFHFDGLRFDAVHEIQDTGPKHILAELAEDIRSCTDGRHVHLVVENSHNQAGWLVRRADGTPRFYTAQWSDDVHHLLHVAATGERSWYYEDYADNHLEMLGRALAEGFAYQGQYRQRLGENSGEPSAFLPATAFVTFLQNHDHVGNRPLGERLSHLVDGRAVRALAAILFLSPHIPLVMMGEEFAANTPFLFFTDPGEDLVSSIREGRQAEYRQMPIAGGRVPPDPVAEATFTASKLRWEELQRLPQAEVLSLYKRLIEVRREMITPHLAGMAGNAGKFEVSRDGLRVSWRLSEGVVLTLLANLSNQSVTGIDVGPGPHLWLEGTIQDDSLGPWSVVFTLTKETDSL